MANPTTKLDARFPQIKTVLTSTVDLASIANGASLLTTVSYTPATGAATIDLGDFVLVSCSIDAAGLAFSAYVSASNTVKINALNNTGGAVDLASATFRIVVLEKLVGIANP